MVAAAGFANITRPMAGGRTVLACFAQPDGTCAQQLLNLVTGQLRPLAELGKDVPTW